MTDMTSTGALLRPATPQNPVYYIGLNLGYRDLGGIIAGDKLPAKETMVKTITHVLAKQGYIPATTRNPPSIVLLWTWGTLYTERFGSSDLFPMGQQVNRTQLMRFLGGDKVGLVSKDPQPFSDEMFMPGLFIRSASADAIYDMSSEDLYVAAIAAYDYHALTQKKKVLLWTTRMSCPSRGLQMDQTLPTMLVIAGPNIGRDTVKPVWANATDKFKPDVQIGDPKLVEFLDSSNLPIVDAQRSTEKPKRPPLK